MLSFYFPIVKFILALKLELSKTQLGHLFTNVHGIILCAGRKNITKIKEDDTSAINEFLESFALVRQSLSTATHAIHHG